MTSDGWKVADIRLWYAHPRNADIEPGVLSEGDTLITDKGPVVIENLEELNHRPPYELVYDIILDGDSTYFADGYLVHNCNGAPE